MMTNMTTPPPEAANAANAATEQPTKQGKEEAKAGPLDCARCAQWYLGHTTMIVEAAASVAIEHGMSTAAMLRSYIAGYHNRGHRELG